MDVDFPPLSNWQDFEELMVEVLERKFGVLAPTRYGLQGQSQDGVDVIGQSRHDKAWIAVQCKRLKSTKGQIAARSGGSISADLLRKEVASAEDYNGRVDQFFLATSGFNQPEIQTLAQQMTAERQAKGKFSVQVLFWNDINRYLNRDAVLQSYFYDRFLTGRGTEAKDRHILELIVQAFRRPAFTVQLNCENNDDFFAALKATDRALNTGELYDREGRIVAVATGGYAKIADPTLRAGAVQVARSLSRFRNALLTAKREGRVDQQEEWLNISDPDLTYALEQERDDCVIQLNAMIAPLGLEPLPVRPPRKI